MTSIIDISSLVAEQAAQIRNEQPAAVPASSTNQECSATSATENAGKTASPLQDRATNLHEPAELEGLLAEIRRLKLEQEVLKARAENAKLTAPQPAAPSAPSAPSAPAANSRLDSVLLAAIAKFKHGSSCVP